MCQTEEWTDFSEWIMKQFAIFNIEARINWHKKTHQLAPLEDILNDQLDMQNADGATSTRTTVANGDAELDLCDNENFQQQIDFTVRIQTHVLYSDYKPRLLSSFFWVRQVHVLKNLEQTWLICVIVYGVNWIIRDNITSDNDWHLSKLSTENTLQIQRIVHQTTIVDHSLVEIEIQP